MTNIHLGNGPTSQVATAILEYLRSGYTYLPIESQIEENWGGSFRGATNIMQNHAYWFLYLVSPLVYFFPASLVLSIVKFLFLAGFATAVFYFVRLETKSRALAVTFTTLVGISPVFTGYMFGQFYPDRLFLFLGFFLFAVAWRNCNSVWLIPIGILAASTHERSALIGGATLLGIALIRPGTFWAREKMMSLAVGASMVVYGLVMILFYLPISSHYYSGFLPRSFSGLVSNLALPGFLDNIGVFFLVNAPLLFLALVKWRFGLLALITLLPNLIGNIGGAEKVGWVTHYHSFYFPVLVFAAALGVHTLSKKLDFRVT